MMRVVAGFFMIEGYTLKQPKTSEKTRLLTLILDNGQSFLASLKAK